MACEPVPCHLVQAVEVPPALELVAYEIKVSHAGSVLGLAWAVVQPLLFLGAYWFLLSVLDARHLGPGGTEAEIVALLSGLVVWPFFSRAVAGSLGSLTRHAALIKQVNFPFAAVPFVNVGVQGVEFLVGVAALLIVAAATGVLAWTALLLVPAAILLAAFLVAVATHLGPLAVMLPDLRRLMVVGLRAGLFLTPVLYLPSALPDSARLVAELNPAAYFVGLVRYGATGTPEALLFDLPTDLAIATAFTSIAVLAAAAWRRPARRLVVDHL
jgi:lipopolysaccharide transport system permease protein